MSRTWHGAPEPDPPPVPPAGWARALSRGAVLGLVVFGGLALLLALRLVERPLFGQWRPVTPWITQGVCRAAFAILGIRYARRGLPMRGRAAVVANHVSWLDIFALNASDRIYFVSKDEVRGWPGIGWLARATGTVFIAREARQAGDQRRLFERRLGLGHRLLFFPEGTSTDGRNVLRFNSTLFSAFFSQHFKSLSVQPVTLVYHAPEGAPASFYGWWGGMEFGPHLLKVLAAPRQGTVEVVYHDPLPVARAGDRKALARAAEAAVRVGLEQRLACG